MNKKSYQHLAHYRKSNHLKLRDVAYLLNIDETSLSRFETGQRPNPKATLGYMLLFNLSTPGVIRQGLLGDVDDILTRAFKLQERIADEGASLRSLSIDKIITRLTAHTENE